MLELGRSEAVDGVERSLLEALAVVTMILRSQRISGCPLTRLAWPLTEVAAFSREGEKLDPSRAGAPFWASATGGARVWRAAFLAGVGQFQGRGVVGCQPNGRENS